MKDILKIMRFDFQLAKPIALKQFVVVVLVCTLLSLLYAPLIAAYCTFSVMLFVIPLQRIVDKSNLHMLYGILPVSRKNIARARFYYIFAVHFFAELLELLIARTARTLSLYRYFPNQNSELMQMVAHSFVDKKLTYVMIVGIFLAFCLLFSYMEMMGQIFGREHEFKIVLITLLVLTGIYLLFIQLTEHGVIPVFRLPSLPTSRAGVLSLVLVLHLATLGLCILFGEITASRNEKCEMRN